MKKLIINSVVYITDFDYEKVLSNIKDKTHTLVCTELTKEIFNILTFMTKLNFKIVSIRIKILNCDDIITQIEELFPSIIKRLEYLSPTNGYFEQPHERIEYLYKGDTFDIRDNFFNNIEPQVQSSLDNNDTQVIFNLWNNCNNRCTFCWTMNTKEGILTNEQKHEQFIAAKKLLLSLDYPVSITLRGGELFDDLEFYDDWFDLANFIISMIKLKKVNKIYLVSNLLFDDCSILLSIHEQFERKGLKDNISIMCSWDIAGRFKTLRQKYQFARNFIKLRQAEIKCFINSVLTGPMCRAIINDPDKFFHYVNKLYLQASPYGYDANEYNLQQLYPTKDEVYQVLKLWKRYDINYLKQYEYIKINYKSNLVNKDKQICSKHPKQTFTNSNECFFCLVDKVLKEKD